MYIGSMSLLRVQITPIGLQVKIILSTTDYRWIISFSPLFSFENKHQMEVKSDQHWLKDMHLRILETFHRSGLGCDGCLDVKGTLSLSFLSYAVKYARTWFQKYTWILFKESRCIK